MKDEELLKKSYAMYKKLGGEQNEVARMLRMLWERWESAKQEHTMNGVCTLNHANLITSTDWMCCPECGADLPRR